MARSMKAKVMTLADLKPAKYNPRRIGDAAKVALGKSLGEFGDISGLVYNKRSGTLVAGHQRLDALKAEHGDALKMDDGAVVTPSGERFRVRVVDWPPAKEKAANVAANSPLLSGEFTEGLSAILDEIKIELPDLVDALRLDDLDVTNFTPFAESPPETVEQNREEIESIHRQRKEGNAVVSDERDTENYLVVVFPNRSAKEAACVALGLAADDRYIPSSALSIIKRALPRRTDLPKAARADHSGATGGRA